MISRAQALEAVQADQFDVVVIGGGITGAGVALDAASRGYSVALLERFDFSQGTSSRSSKMVHGGLRYLQNFDLGLVREALLERQLMVQLAPHLVYPTPYLVPTLGEKRRDRRIGIGLNMYDVMSTARVGRGRAQRAEHGDEEGFWWPDRHRTIDSEEVVKLIPALGPLDPSSAYLFYDCQTDDSRLVLTVLGEAERFGAVPLNGAEVTDILDEGGRAAGVRCRDADTGESFEVRAANVVNATGVWADRIRPDEILEEEEIPRIAPSRGAHITLATKDLDIGTAACIVPAGADRTIFALPWYGRVLVGTTDNDYDGGIDEVAPGDDDVAYLLDAINDYFDLDIGRDRITGAFAGVRPLISTGDPKKSVDISRRAELYETSSGMLTITGGKLTTWRRMAEQTVDRIVERDGRDARCRTDDIPLGMPARDTDLDSELQLPDGAREQLAFRYGHAARQVLALAAERPELAAPILPGHPDLLAEAVLAARQEQARSLSDVLLRRTRLGLVAASSLREEGPLRMVAGTMAGELGWSEDEVARQIEGWREDVRSEGLDPGVSA
ncbi:MAG TPA: glycerol-3-phosphate dehydrogenase/oxidase [Solirubrobacterales bacterium]|nr:glycerol-3-phosphate dehydrogenase/oxidase [Solirubrobacterales bacterium]